MNRNEIIELADSVWGYAYWGPAQLDRLERFAALVAAAEREQCAKVAEWEPCITCTPKRVAAAIRARGLK